MLSVTTCKNVLHLILVFAPFVFGFITFYRFTESALYRRIFKGSSAKGALSQAGCLIWVITILVYFPLALFLLFQADAVCR
jgi:hypothetical protein